MVMDKMGTIFKAEIPRKTVFTIIVVLAIVLRLGAAYYLQDSFFERGNRFSIINPISVQMIAGNGFAAYPGGPTADNEPVYPLFVTLAYALMGRGWWSIAIIQTCITLLHAWLVYKIANFMFSNDYVAKLSAVILLFYPIYAIAAISVTDTVFFSCLLALCTFSVIRYVSSERIIWGIATGIIWGMAVLTRMSAVALFPAVIIYMWVSLDIKKCMRMSLIIMICLLATILPWVWRNYNLTGRPFITSHGAIELWFAYNEDTERIIKNNISVDKMRIGLSERIPEIGAIRNQKELLPIEREILESDIFKKEAFGYMFAHPILSLKMMPLKLWKLWSWNYSPVPTSPDHRQDMLRRAMHTISYGILLLFGLVGVVFYRPSFWKRHSLVISYFICYSALHSLIYGFSRLRWPIDQFLVMYAAYAIVCLFSDIYKPRKLS